MKYFVKYCLIHRMFFDGHCSYKRDTKCLVMSYMEIKDILLSWDYLESVENQ